MKTAVYILGFFFFVSGMAYSQNATVKAKLTEAKKIEMLISYVRDLKGAVFIRNGTEHDAKGAAEHLAMKRDKAGKRIKTAVEFIVNIASKSSVSGKPYSIKFADGKTVSAQQALAEELKRIEKLNN